MMPQAKNPPLEEHPMSDWLDNVCFVPFLDDELLKVRQALSDKVSACRADGYAAQADGYERLLSKLSGMHGRDYKIVPLTDADRDTIAA